MRIALLHPQCRTQGGAIKMALLTAQSLQKQGHEVTLYTFDYSPECFPELQKGLTIRDRSLGNIKTGLGLDTVDTTPLFSRQKISPLQKVSRSISLAWHVRHVDIIVANNPPMQIVAAMAKVFRSSSDNHKLSTIWWHHHVPWYSSNPGFPSPKISVRIKGWLERYIILPRIDYLIATSEYVAECLKHYCGREATVIHPIIVMPEEIQNTKDTIHNEGMVTRPLTLFTHGRLEPGKGLETLVKIWKELQQMNNEQGIMNNEEIKLLIAGDGSLKNWLIEQGATVVPYYEGLLEEVQKSTSDTLAIYLSTIDAFGMASLEAQIAGLPTIILDRGGARETVLLDSFGAPVGRLVGTGEEISQMITYFIQHRSLHKTTSNVNFCHQRDYFSPTRLDADIRSLIGFVG